MQSFIKWLGDYWLVAAILGAGLVEITPIKVNPLSWLLKWVGSKVNGEMIKRIDKLEANVDTNEMDRIRWEVLDFANSCRNGRRHTQDEFEHIVTLVKKYEGLLEKLGKENGVFEMEYKYIVKLYEKCQQENDFI